MGLRRRQAQIHSCHPSWRGKSVWEAALRDPWIPAQAWLRTSEKPFSTPLHLACLTFPAGIVPRGSFDLNIPGKFWKLSLLLHFLIFCKHQAWTGTFWKTHSHAHIATQSNTYAWPISHSCTPSWLNLPTPSTNYTHLRHTRTLGLSHSHSPFHALLPWFCMCLVYTGSPLPRFHL